MKIDKKLLNEEMKVDEYSVYACDLGLKPGDKHPAQLEINIGNGKPFIRSETRPSYTNYYQELSCVTVSIIND